jgi:hypothetical protein
MERVVCIPEIHRADVAHVFCIVPFVRTDETDVSPGPSFSGLPEMVSSMVPSRISIISSRKC